MINLEKSASEAFVYTKLIESIKSHNFPIFLSLIKERNIDSPLDSEDQTILHIAAKYDFIDAVLYFIEKKGNLNYQNVFGNTALHLCVEYRRIKIASLLLEFGARFDIPNQDGNEALWYAINVYDKNDLAALKLLLRYTDRIFIENNYGVSPYSLAQRIGDQFVIDILNQCESNIEGSIQDSFDQLNFNSSPSTIAKWVWDNLIPSRGQALTIQGELFRSIEKLRWETQENGCVNWDENHCKFIDFIERTLNESKLFSLGEYKKINRSIALLRKIDSKNFFQFSSEVNDVLFDELEGFSVRFFEKYRELIYRDVDLELNR
ncbi:ankyrin repeat domain-containing protein [Shewanella sp. 202IG2-18]|uniref:ankyrin repeat domain-containing protein n=1 Tax=Parashewanella hymeniacidonis TaxID=2807618 RepID=UPI001961B4AF|nr:ankyrin repeat domain-containing protein [Parashewanella hymeniacidonis]MBM7070938.1 ankyrin repeat domain-containing protein [Parashewanella hymeniacidonis]